MSPAESVLLESRTDVTVDELERLSLPYPAELYDGRVVYKMPNFAHGVIQARIAQRFNNYLERNPAGLISGDANYRLWPDRNRESRAPDISFIRRERLPQNLDRFLSVSPDLAIEILSPSDSFEHVMEKVDEYLQQGVQVVWIMMPGTRKALVCSTQGQYIEREVLTAPEILPGFELPVAEIFAGLEAKSGQ